ncbi:beta-galactosidase [Rossellomorea marisflavi]|uniref:beta-galactosidase n=1 Tax=Rossellomorea marisflavi TaxID=189381 RepID=UPI00296E678D|nr:beta-galactosidase [Rossellomorea marisflavi]MDW4528257.1 beta-galactosidase [Rossellomorea marisflavi]
MYLGVDYYPEHWPKDMMDEDLDGIKEMGSTMIRIGEFAWHLMESRQGEFDFSFFDEVISKAKERNLSVMFGTPTATFPAWLAKKHPSILSKDERGLTRSFGGRRQYCFNSKDYWTYSSRITEELVKHYSKEPGITVWQIDNEFGHEGSDQCYCGQCHEGFQTFLEDKYKTVDELNEHWGTIFWGQTYNGFDEIPMPTPTVTTHNPSLKLDWAKFRSFSVNRYAKEMVRIVREFKGDHQLVTTNVSGGFFDKWFDHPEHARELDVVSYDNYPVWGGLTEPISPAEVAMNHDFNRGLLGKNYWIVEELMGAQGHDVIGYLPRPNQAKMWSYQAFAHGCTDLLYFRWRGMTKGAEQFCFGVVDHDNHRGRKYKEVQSLFSEIKSHEELLNAPIQADVAVLYSYANIWSWRSQIQSSGFDFTKELTRMYQAFYDWNTAIDVIPVDRSFDSYKVLVVPVMQMMDSKLSDRLRTFADNGGTILFSFRTGLRDEDNNIRLGEALPGMVNDLCGIRIHETEALADGQELTVKGEGTGTVTVWRDLITPDTAEVLYRYQDPFYEEKAAVTRNTYGKGQVYYIGGGLDHESLKEIGKSVIDRHGIWSMDTEPGVEVYKRTLDGKDHLFLLNHTGDEKIVGNHTLAPYASTIVEWK